LLSCRFDGSPIGGYFQFSPVLGYIQKKEGKMRKICISLSKGGVAKSTSAVSIAHGLAMAGKKTLLIDSDDQGQDSYLLGVNPKQGLAEVLNEEATPMEAACEARPNLFILSGGKSLSAVKRSIGRKDFGAEKTLSEALSPIEGKFDFVLIDTSPAWDALTINALFYCDEVITPVSLEVLSLNSLAEFSQRLDGVRKFNPKLKHAFLLPTFADGRVKKSKEIMTLLEKHYKSILCDPVRYCARISEASGFGQTIFEYAPRSTGALDYKSIVQKVVDR
jgi:chromosome partitioning protein